MLDVLESKQLQARTCLIIVDTIDTCYCSCGHDSGDVLWWWEDGQIETASGDQLHGDILSDPDDMEFDREYETSFEDYIRGRYDIKTGRISLLPDKSYMTIPRGVFRALEKKFPEAIEIALY